MAPVVAVVTAAVAVHARTVAFGFTWLDDVDLVVGDHAFLAHASALWRAFGRSHLYVVDPRHAYYRPLVTASYALDAWWSGVAPGGYHATNVALHATACALLYALLRRLAFGRGISLAAAVVFAVHPVVASAVAWIPGRNDVLLAVFALASWLAFVRDRTGGGSWRDRALHLGFFALALFTKETAIVVPLVCLAHVALAEPDAWARLRRPAAIARLVAAWGAVVAAWVVARTAATQQAVGDTAVGAMRALGAGALGVVAGLGQAVVPTRLSLIADAADVPVWPGIAVACLVVLVVWRIRGVRRRVVALGLGVFAAWLAPAVAAGGTLFLESRLYLPVCGAVIVAAEAARALVADRRALAAGAATVAGVLALVTLAYEGTFRDRMAFARNAVDESPRCSLAHFCLGQALHASGQPGRALDEYQAALTLGATYAVHNDIAVLYMADARWADAERELRAEIAVDPDFAAAHENLGVVLRREGRLEEACVEQDRALSLDPTRERAQHEKEQYCGAL